MLVIWQFSAQASIQATRFDWLDFLIKKTAHLGEYAILFGLLFRATGMKSGERSFLIGLFYAFVDEIHQMFSPGRTAKLRDVLIFDGIGLAIGWFMVLRIKVLRQWLKK